MKARTLALLLLLPILAFAQVPKETTPHPAQEIKPPTPNAASHPLTGADIEAFLDGLLPLQLDRENIAGCVVAVVKDGQVIFEKGYGYSDVKARKAVSPTDTLFRPGSISKLFTWTSVMQLVEQGKLDLDRDVNDYLDFKIPPAFNKPITLRNLMTHTPGFEETDKDLITDNPADNMPLDRYLKNHVPRRIFSPGTTPAYSNYGATLAGYIVQRVSGQPFDDYVEQHIFQPLRMTHSSFRQPLPPSLQPLMSQGYKTGSGEAKKFEFVVPAPAGALAASADDITRFMIAQLQDGRFEGTQILQAQTAQQMHTRQTQTWSNPALNGMALGFYEETRNGHRIIGHGGDTIYFHSDLHLVPDAQLGFFISYNSAGSGQGGSPRGAVWRAFLDRYFPYGIPEIKPPASAADDNRSVLGSYITSRRCDSCILRGAALSSEITFKAGPDGSIVASALKGPNLQPRHWKEIAPLVYRDVNSQEKIAFTRMPDGVMRMAAGADIVVDERVPWYLTTNFVLFLLGGSAIFFALTLVLWIITALVRWHYAGPAMPDTLGAPTRIAVRLVFLLALAAMAGWFWFFSLAGDNLSALSTHSDTKLHLLQVLTLLALILMVIPIIAMLRALLRGAMWWWSRVFYTLAGLAAIAFCWIVILCQLLDFSLRY